MGVIKCRGLVINAFDVGEADKYLVLLTKELGKIRASAKGARRLKSKYLSGSALFTYADFVLFEGNHFYSITQIDIIENFRNISQDFEKICYGNYFLEIIDKTIFENEPNDDILKLALKALQTLNGGLIMSAVAARAFEFKFMQLNGYTPEMQTCVVCGGAIEKGAGIFGVEGLLCRECAEKATSVAHISDSVMYAIHYILHTDTRDVFKFNADENTQKGLKAASDIFMRNLGITIKSREIIDQI